MLLTTRRLGGLAGEINKGGTKASPERNVEALDALVQDVQGEGHSGSVPFALAEVEVSWKRPPDLEEEEPATAVTAKYRSLLGTTRRLMTGKAQRPMTTGKSKGPREVRAIGSRRGTRRNRLSNSSSNRGGAAAAGPASYASTSLKSLSSWSASSLGDALPSGDPLNPSSAPRPLRSKFASLLDPSKQQFSGGPSNVGIYEPPLAPHRVAYEAAFERSSAGGASLARSGGQQGGGGGGGGSAVLQQGERGRIDSTSSYLSNMTDDQHVDSSSVNESYVSQVENNSFFSFTDRSSAGLEAFMRSAPTRSKQRGAMGYLSREELKKDVGDLLSTKHHIYGRWAQHGNGHECTATKAFMEDYEFRDTPLGSMLDDYRSELYGHNDKHQHPIKRALNHGERDHWGALVSALAHGWKPDVDACWEAACGDLRYVVFDDDVRSAGYATLLYDSDASACYRSMTHQLASDDILGVDFFVCHDWVDESASYRWQALCLLSDDFKVRYGRWPRFWIDKFCMKPPEAKELAELKADAGDKQDAGKSSSAYFKYRTEVVAVVIAVAKSFLLLQDPHAMGSFEPPQRPAIDVIYELFFATLYAPKRSEAARELHGCTHNVLVLKLFWGRTIPPAVDLLDGIASTAVRCSSGPVQVAIMDILMRLPGGLPQVQKAVAQVFQELNQHEYHDWQQLRYAAGHGDTGKMGALLDSGCYPYALQPIGGELPPLAIACMAYARGGKVKKQAIRMLLNAGAAPLSGFNHVKFGELQADERTFEVLDLLFEAGDFYPAVDLVRNALNKAGARIVVEFFHATKKLLSLCGLKAPRPGAKPSTHLILPNRNLTETALVFVSAEEKLTKLDFSGNANIQDSLLPLKQLNYLEYLNMSRCSGVVGTLQPLAPLRSLLTLRLAGCAKLTGTLEPLEGLDQLQYLDLSGCEKIHGTISPLVNAFRLTHLILSHCHSLSGPLEVVKAFESLKHLDMHYCYDIDGTLDALSGCADLEYLELSSTSVEGSLSPLASCGKLRKENAHYENTKLIGKVRGGDTLTMTKKEDYEEKEANSNKEESAAAVAPPESGGKKPPSMREQRKQQKSGKLEAFESGTDDGGEGSDEDAKESAAEAEEMALEVDENGELDPKVKNKLLDKSINATFRTISKEPIFADPGLMMHAPVYVDPNAPVED